MYLAGLRLVSPVFAGEVPGVGGEAFGVAHCDSSRFPRREPDVVIVGGEGVEMTDALDRCADGADSAGVGERLRICSVDVERECRAGEVGTGCLSLTRSLGNKTFGRRIGHSEKISATEEQRGGVGLAVGEGEASDR